MADEVNTDEVNVEGKDEVNTEHEKDFPVMVGPHALGGVAVRVSGVDGSVAEARIDLSQAALVTAHLQALVTMLFQAVYASEMQARQEAGKLIVPGK